MGNEREKYNVWDIDEWVPDQELWRRDIYLFESDRIWGKYKIHRHASVNLKAECDRLERVEANRLKARLGTMLIDRIAQGESEPLVDTVMIDRLIKNSPPLPFAERARRLLRYNRTFEPLDP